ncbi:MAG TPA: type II secretion system major pseudopilin GspG [Gammaproteobacteria bacterium]|nr:type II secretion system major pseudopilin GspG [Gammaproteobacteria bacterium]
MRVLRKVMKGNRGFTLVELLVVIAILGLVMSLVGPQVMKQFADAKSDTTALQIADLGASLDLYYLDVGRYPTTDEGLEALVTAPPGDSAWSGPYLKKDVVPRDPWGRAYVYRAPGEHGAYDLLSFGADGAPGGARADADVASWE